jgi:hypothetical protein
MRLLTSTVFVFLASPAQSRNFLDAMRGLSRWAKAAGHVTTDPTGGVANPMRSRRGDAVRFGRQHVRDGVGTIKTEKSKHTVEVTQSILPVLAATVTLPAISLSFAENVANR